jgi:hypothetical protein
MGPKTISQLRTAYAEREMSLAKSERLRVNRLAPITDTPEPRWRRRPDGSCHDARLLRPPAARSALRRPAYALVRFGAVAAKANAANMALPEGEIIGTLTNTTDAD